MPLSVFLALVPRPFIESAWRSWEPLMSFTKYVSAYISQSEFCCLQL